jgi:hypothetical protein
MRTTHEGVHEDVLILGSGLAIRRLDGIDTAGWTVVAMNRAWQFRPGRVDHVVHGDLLPGSLRPPTERFPGRVHSYSDYRPIVDACARCWAEAHDEVEALADPPIFLTGHLIHFNATYWVLSRLKPQRIAYLGCDFDYGGETSHYYGRGQAVFAEERGRAPLATYFERLQWFADRAGTTLQNLSPEGPTLLPYPRLSIAARLSSCDGEAD